MGDYKKMFVGLLPADSTDRTNPIRGPASATRQAVHSITQQAPSNQIISRALSLARHLNAALMFSQEWDLIVLEKTIVGRRYIKKTYRFTERTGGLEIPDYVRCGLMSAKQFEFLRHDLRARACSFHRLIFFGNLLSSLVYLSLCHGRHTRSLIRTDPESASTSERAQNQLIPASSQLFIAIGALHTALESTYVPRGTRRFPAFLAVWIGQNDAAKQRGRTRTIRALVDLPGGSGFHHGKHAVDLGFHPINQLGNLSGLLSNANLKLNPLPPQFRDAMVQAIGWNVIGGRIGVEIPQYYCRTWVSQPTSAIARLSRNANAVLIPSVQLTHEFGLSAPTAPHAQSRLAQLIGAGTASSLHPDTSEITPEKAD
ncbi:hypothetical protein B0H12DRAFT_1223728 [Mycena haematopus]|nr:hypothetical protein B0H12DRAFT_1223728 [Mycena haematopus]